VLPDFRRPGIASALMDLAEEYEGARSRIAGIGVGLYADYGPAPDVSAAQLALMMTKRLS
jgi:hypothetical protein